VRPLQRVQPPVQLLLHGLDGAGLAAAHFRQRGGLLALQGVLRINFPYLSIYRIFI
jgi:hypothetical protein